MAGATAGSPNGWRLALVTDSSGCERSFRFAWLYFQGGYAAVRIDRPDMALDLLQDGLENFPNDQDLRSLEVFIRQ
ncbi:MAG: hypothetical protein AAGD13_20870 [Pseudomonadota bacterium]